jgi:hypothetical protein
MDGIDLLRRQALAKRNAAIQAARRGESKGDGNQLQQAASRVIGDLGLVAVC